jgi:hypothetical protein
MATQTAGTGRRDPVGKGGHRADITARTLRTDRWWTQPLVIAVLFAAFVVYATWAAFDHHFVASTGNRIFYADPYQSPFYSPCFTDGCPSVISWGHVDFWHWLSPALYILIFPLSFRATCYYYRKAYYRAFWFSPPACAVSEPHSTYTGETRFPLLFQNIHRYTWYFAVIFAGILSYDAGRAFDFHGSFGLGVGTGVLVVNAVLIVGYTLGCHSCRHITSGRINSFSKHPLRYRWWTLVSKLNRRHMQWAWASLVWVAVADGYVRLVASGTITDYHHIF